MFLSLSLSAFGADYYMSADGAGAKDGSSWENAMHPKEIVSLVNEEMKPGDVLYLSGPTSEDDDDHYGDLRFSITSSGTEEQPLQMIGVDRGFGTPLFRGKQKVRSYATFRFKEDSSYWTLKNLQIERREIGIETGDGTHRGLVFENIIVSNVREAGFQFQDCDRLLVRNCRVQRYTEVGYRFSHSCDEVALIGVVADCSGTGPEPAEDHWKSTSSPVGFDFHYKKSKAPPNTDIVMRNCVAINNREIKPGKKYPQGDGFKFERSNERITLIGCVANWNRDAGYDLKGSEQTLQNCAAISNARYGFKLWYDGVMDNCVSVGNGSRQLTLPATSGERTITVNRSTFHMIADNDRAVGTETAGTTAVLNDCILSFAGKKGTYNSGKGTFVLNRTELFQNAGDPENSPRYVNPELPWTGLGDNFDNLEFRREKGYNSELVEQVF
tara:strand:+ start:252 stop:1574 length:1323 start_codon:yes stop_codon:yes gene_type:complete